MVGTVRLVGGVLHPGWRHLLALLFCLQPVFHIFHHFPSHKAFIQSAVQSQRVHLLNRLVPFLHSGLFLLRQ